MQHPQIGDIIDLVIIPDNNFTELKVLEWENEWIRVSENQTTPAGIEQAIHTINTKHIIRYTVTKTVTQEERSRPTEPVSSELQRALPDVESKLLERVKSLAELRVEQIKAKSASIRDFLPSESEVRKRKFLFEDKYELPSFAKYTKNET